MSNEKRLSRLYPALSAKERALLMLRDYKARKEQDPQLLRLAPEKQTRELNRLIGLMNAANHDLANLITIIAERAEKEHLRFSFLVWATGCARDAWLMRAFLNLYVKQPMTQSEYRQRQQDAREELMSIEECATILTEAHTEWDEQDLETGEDGRPTPTDPAWYRFQRARKKELRLLLAQGSLEGTKRPARVACGSFYDWWGQPVAVVPEWGIDCDVRPDTEAKHVEFVRSEHQLLVDLVNKSACTLDLPLDMERPLLVEPPSAFNEEFARVLAVMNRAAVQENWRQLRAIELKVYEINEEFDGEDVLRDDARRALEVAKRTLLEVQEGLQRYTGPFELPEPDDEVRALVERIVEHEVRHVPHP